MQSWYLKYPSNRTRRKYRRAILRLAKGPDGLYYCEWCGKPVARKKLNIHHVGVPFANGQPGDPRDKHDLRRENLVAICFECHNSVEPIALIHEQFRLRRERNQAKREAHRALGIGTGLVVLEESA